MNTTKKNRIAPEYKPLLLSLIHIYRAAAHYNEAAEPQRLVIDRLVQLLEEHLPKTERHFAHAFEMGTGSGLLTERVDQLLEVDHWTLADLSPALLAQVPRLRDSHPELRVGDASELSLEGLGIDLFISSRDVYKRQTLGLSLSKRLINFAFEISCHIIISH